MIGYFDDEIIAYPRARAPVHSRLFRVEHTGGMSLGDPILENGDKTFAKFSA
jgi:hypothetical protein